MSLENEKNTDQEQIKSFHKNLDLPLSNDPKIPEIENTNERKTTVTTYDISEYYRVQKLIMDWKKRNQQQ